ncbi:hypothetical protein B0H10DRAFT_2191069 [Mycena sp. CBHHK59/15]|nr:hypothetical protein B0H10DRAFT_2191069 [Mycena sp. CBHHK59/15]
MAATARLRTQLPAACWFTWAHLRRKPASPAKKSQISLNTDIHVPREPEQPPQKEWQANYSEFDAEYGPGLNKRGSDYPNEQWARLNHVEFLDKLVRHDGRGDYMDQGCIVELHQRTPLHHIEKWNGVFFEPWSLKALDVRIQLGHPPGEKCANPVKAPGDDFVIINSHTIDEVGLDYCDCGSAKLRPIQLLRMRLYPRRVQTLGLRRHSLVSTASTICRWTRNARHMSFTTV